MVSTFSDISSAPVQQMNQVPQKKESCCAWLKKVFCCSKKETQPAQPLALRYRPAQPTNAVPALTLTELALTIITAPVELTPVQELTPGMLPEENKAQEPERKAAVQIERTLTGHSVPVSSFGGIFSALQAANDAKTNKLYS